MPWYNVFISFSERQSDSDDEIIKNLNVPSLIMKENEEMSFDDFKYLKQTFGQFNNKNI